MSWEAESFDCIPSYDFFAFIGVGGVGRGIANTWSTRRNSPCVCSVGV